MAIRRTKQLPKMIALYAAFALPMGFVGYLLTHGIHADPLPDNSVSLSTSNVDYKVGDTIKFYIGNNTTSTLYVKNNCPQEPLSVYRKTSGSWEQIHASTDTASCKDQPREYAIPANTTIPGSYDKWQSLFSTPGSYEIRLQVDGSDTILKQDFEVEQ